MLVIKVNTSINRRCSNIMAYGRGHFSNKVTNKGGTRNLSFRPLHPNESGLKDGSFFIYLIRRV